MVSSVSFIEIKDELNLCTVFSRHKDQLFLDYFPGYMVSAMRIPWHR